MIVRNFFTLYVSADRTLRGGKTRNMGFKATLAKDGTERNSGRGPKTEKHNLLVLGTLLGGKSGRPKSFSPKVPIFVTFYILANRTPTGGKS